ncbi:MAG: HAD family hydrolase [bacterium]
MVKFVYFDVGGVIVLDFSKSNKWNELREELRIPKEREKEFMFFWQRYETEICTTFKISTIVDKLEKKFGIKIPKDYSLLTDGFISRFEVNKSMWSVLAYVKNNFKIGLLTDQYIGMLKEVKKAHLFPNIDLDVVIDSSVVGLSKSNPKIFELGEKLAKVKGDEILFIDNSLGRIAVAKKLGWVTFLYDPANPQKSSQKLMNFVKKIVKK